MNEDSVVWHPSAVGRTDKEALSGHRSAVVWFTGLSGAGKSTIANAVEERLHRAGCRTVVLDGDNIRHGLCADLRFGDADRDENIRRVGEVARLFVEAGVIVLAAFISPFRQQRDRVRSLFAEGEFLEVHCRCSLRVCEGRDAKGLYRRARAGEITHFTGISSPYEEPEQPELALDTDRTTLDAAVDEILGLLRQRGIVPMPVTGR